MVSKRLMVPIACLVLISLAPVEVVAQNLSDSDAELEACLSEGKILKGAEELIGITRPVRVQVECGGTKQDAVFKNVHKNWPGNSKLDSGETVFNLTDSYRYDRAAFLLDRQLGLDMVPVVVPQKRKGTEGVLVAWLPNTVPENKVETRFGGKEMASVFRQKSRMHLFDSLIYNIDRRAENIMVDESTARIYLIDHTRAFREDEELRPEFAEGRVWMSRALYDNLVALNEENLAGLTDDNLITKRQLKTLLVRRDLIVAKIDQDRQEHGDEAVFTE